MTIVFVCGSIERGRDGVGDYTRLLAVELTKIGHHCSILALADKFINKEIFGEENEGEIKIDFLRLPFRNGHFNNSILAKEWIKSRKPDWVSIQYVPFSFHKKGLPFGIAKSFRRISEGTKLHIMFHEMWVGISKISPLKHKVIGFFQIRIVKRLIKVSSPVYVTTTNKLYSLVLEKESIKSSILTLFSNIKKKQFDSIFFSKKLHEFSISIEERPQWILVGIFGSLYPEVNLQAEIEFHLKRIDSKNLKLAFISIGRIGESGLKDFFRLKALFESKVKFILVGEVTETDASQIIQMLDVAVSCTPSQHIAKSGVFAFLKLHQIPTRLISKEILPEYEMKTVEWYKEFVNRTQGAWDISTVAREFSSQLTSKNIIAK